MRTYSARKFDDVHTKLTENFPIFAAEKGMSPCNSVAMWEVKYEPPNLDYKILRHGGNFLAESLLNARRVLGSQFPVRFRFAHTLDSQFIERVSEIGRAHV